MKRLFTYTMLLVCLFSIIVQAQKHSISKKTDRVFHYTKFNINNISSFVYNDGDFDISASNDSGLEYPKGSNKTLVYESGLIWGAKINGIVHVGGNTFNQGLVPGRVLDDGTPQNPEDPSARVFRVRPDYKSSNLLPEIDDEELTFQEIFDQYKKDWDEWPAEFGAPFNDLDGNGVYNPQIDIPGVPGAHQTLWYVANDFDTNAVLGLYGSDPMKIEIQVTVWGYGNTVTPYNDILFRKYRVINKSETNFEEMYLSQYTDPDLGGAGDDYVGCDSTLNLAYAYNGDGFDTQYQSQIPTIGFKLVQGPIVKGTNNDEAIFDNHIITGYKNLSTTSSFRIHKVGIEHFGEPDLGDYENGTLKMYNLMKGLGAIGNRYLNPLTGKYTNFSFTGDPVLEKGWIEKNGNLSPGDRRFMFSSGPFIMQPGDVQEIVIAVIATDKYPNIHWLKYYASQIPNNVGEISRNLKKIPSPPKINPKMNDSQDGIEITWKDDENLKNIENFDSLGFSFQGTNVYQIVAEEQFGKNVIKIATFDKSDNITSIEGTILDNNGLPITGIIQNGTNSGIKREFLIKKDYEVNKDLIKGKNYSFGVSSYFYNGNNSTGENSIESLWNTLQIEYIKDLAGINYGDTLSGDYTNVDGAEIIPIVVNPNELTGLDYTVSFDIKTNESGTLYNIWNLDRSDGVRLLENQTNFSRYSYPHGNNDKLSPLFDGIQLEVIYNYDIKYFARVSNEDGLYDQPVIAAAEWAGFPIPVDSNGRPISPPTDTAIGDPPWLIHCADSNTYFSYADFKNKSLRKDNWSRFYPYDWEMRFTKKGSWALRWYEDKHLVKVPFELWNIGIDTPDDPSDDYKLIPYFRSNGAYGFPQTDSNGLTFQLDPIDHSGSGGENDPYTPAIDWIIPPEHLDNSAGTIGYDTYINQIDTTVIGTKNNTEFLGGAEVLAKMVLLSWNGDDISDGEIESGTEMVPKTGTIFRIESSRLLQPSIDDFKFSSKQEVNKIIPEDYSITQNYPNPFNNGTRLRYSLPEDGFVKISVFNILGQKVRELVNDSKLAGNYEIEINSNELASGVYIYRIEVNDFIKSKKMLLLK